MANTTSQPGAPATAEPAWPHPPRFWWTKRLLLGGVIFLLLLAGAWIWWAWEASRRLQAEIDALRARGEPVVPEDLNRPPVADEINAVTYLNRAIRQIHPRIHTPAASNLSWRDELPYPQEWHEMAAAAVEANQAVYPLVRQARQQPEVDWGLQFASPMAGFMPPMLNQARHLANTVGDAALYHHFNGNDAEALQLIHDVLFIADAFDEQPLPVSRLVANGIRALALHRLQVMTTGLTIANAPHPANPSAVAPAQRAEVQRTIDLLLTDPSRTESMKRALAGERIYYLEGGPVDWYILRPMENMDFVRALTDLKRIIEAVDYPNWPAVSAAVPARLEPEEMDPAESLARPITGTYWMGRALLIEFQIELDRRVAATALAVRMYHNDHGRYPQMLEELVPRYLPAVPVDPFAADGRPLGYLIAADGRRPIVYSVGEDGTDQTSDESVLPTTPQYGWRGPSGREPDDQWRDLSAWQDPDPPPPPPTFDDWDWQRWMDDDPASDNAEDVVRPDEN